MNTPTILILCTGNSCRSHLAEGILQTALGDGFDVQTLDRSRRGMFIRSPSR